MEINNVRCVLHEFGGQERYPYALSSHDLHELPITGCLPVKLQDMLRQPPAMLQEQRSGNVFQDDTRKRYHELLAEKEAFEWPNLLPFENGVSPARLRFQDGNVWPSWHLPTCYFKNCCTRDNEMIEEWKQYIARGCNAIVVAWFHFFSIRNIKKSRQRTRTFYLCDAYRSRAILSNACIWTKRDLWTA